MEFVEGKIWRMELLKEDIEVLADADEGFEPILEITFYDSLPGFQDAEIYAMLSCGSNKIYVDMWEMPVDGDREQFVQRIIGETKEKAKWELLKEYLLAEIAE